MLVLKKISYLIFILIIMIIASCSKNGDLPTISIQNDSEYEKTFQELGIGHVFDFRYHLPKANERWTTIYVEKYENGILAEEPIAQLSFGESPEEDSTGRIGFGMMKSN